MGNYSYGTYASLPADTADLTNVYGAPELAAIASFDHVYVVAPETNTYTIHQFKDTVASTTVTVTFKGQSGLAPSTSKVQLQVYNVNGTAWEDASGAGASDNTTAAYTDYTLTASLANTANYLAAGVITWRVYQSATTAPAIMDSLTGGSELTAHWLDSAEFHGVGQVFVGDGGVITSVKFMLKRYGNPSGNLYAKIYASTGTLYTIIPTGSAVATSDAYALPGTLTTSYQEITLTFTGAEQYDTTAATYYVIALEYTGGDANNAVGVRLDTVAAERNYCTTLDLSTWSGGGGAGDNNYYFVVLK